MGRSHEAITSWRRSAAFQSIKGRCIQYPPDRELDGDLVGRRLQPGQRGAGTGCRYGTVGAFAVLHAGAAALGVFAAAFLAVRLVGSRLVDELGPRAVILGSALLEAVALAGVASGVWTLAGLVLPGASLALVFPRSPCG
jgi:hypothetical protein